jgi:outer membrane lipase/esterase
LVLATTALAETEPRFDQVAVFGDSLSDTGNAGRFSNGPVWVEHLSARLGVRLEASQTGGLNFSVGGAHLNAGAGAQGLRAQADLFLRRPQPEGRTLYIVFGGGNDLLAEIGQADAIQRAGTVARSLAGIAADLARHGARDLLVPNLPDIGMTPAVRARGDAAVLQAGKLSEAFNAALDHVLAELGAANPELRIYSLDVHGMARSVRTDPGAFGFKDVVAPCRDLPSCEGYLFWDDVHPTTRAHERLAEAAFGTLSAPQQK